MIVAFSISPAAGDETGSVSEAVAEAIRIVRASGLPNETNAMFTNIEGEWDEVMAVVKQAVEAVTAVSPRVSLVLKADIRPGYTGQLTAKVDASSKHSPTSSQWCWSLRRFLVAVFVGRRWRRKLTRSTATSVTSGSVSRMLMVSVR